MCAFVAFAEAYNWNCLEYATKREDLGSATQSGPCLGQGYKKQKPPESRPRNKQNKQKEKLVIEQGQLMGNKKGWLKRKKGLKKEDLDNFNFILLITLSLEHLKYLKTS